MSPEVLALIYYAYLLGGNTREMSFRTGIPHDVITNALFVVAQQDAIDQLHQEAAEEDKARGLAR